MVRHIFKRMVRMPIPVIAVLLFGFMVSVIICSLHASNEAETINYQLTYHTIPVELTVTNLSATRTDNLDAPGWVLDVFTGGNYTTHNFAEYVTDIQVKSSHQIDSIEETEYNASLTGITSISCSKQLLPENGCQIIWQEGYDENIFAEKGMLCIVPYDMLAECEYELQTLTMNFSHIVYHGNKEEDQEIYEYQCVFTVAGTYLGGDGISVYCPYSTIEQVYVSLGEEQQIDSLCATLTNNDELEELRAMLGYWFAEPNPLGERTFWGRNGYEYYPYALDIGDELLIKTTAALEKSITINQACTLIIYVLSAAAGFLIGFLIVRNRKKEIALMRTLGTQNFYVHLSLILEQMLCIILGIVLGGACNLWHPIGRLGILALVYFVGLIFALQVFLRNNLLTTIKEDE